MTRKTTVLPCLMLALALAGCGGAPDPAEAEPTPSTPAPTPEAAGEAASTPQLQGRGGLVRLEDKGLRVVRNYTAQFYEGDLSALHDRFTPELKQSFSLELLTELRENVLGEYGRELEVIGEESQTSGEYRGFMRWVRFEKHDGVVGIQWTLREDDSIAGLSIESAQTPDS